MIMMMMMMMIISSFNNNDDIIMYNNVYNERLNGTVNPYNKLPLLPNYQQAYACREFIAITKTSTIRRRPYVGVWCTGGSFFSRPPGDLNRPESSSSRAVAFGVGGPGRPELIRACPSAKNILLRERRARFVSFRLDTSARRHP
jgi:hypothetical protein